MAERLWAGWRMAYIRRAKEEGERARGSGTPDASEACLFCGLLGQPVGPDSLVLETYRHSFVVLNAFPYTGGHLMVAPRAHTVSLAGSGAEERAEILAALERARRALERSHGPHGFNIGANLGRAAGAGVPDHLHWHVVPRWHGDTNFMPSLADTRVIPEALGETYQRLSAALAELAPEGVTLVERAG